jgi:ADP-ribose pyrophosphatase YjhB (NUDIX family)
MMEAKPESKPELLRAAGGLVWREGPDGPQLAIVYRNRYGGEWALPKGKLQAGETWLAAAAREVREETGYRVRMGPFAGCVSYEVDGQPKLVRFWHMFAVGQPEETQGAEVREVAWVTIDQARQRLRYPLEVALVEGAEAPAAEPSPRSRVRDWWQSLWQSTSHTRLAQTLAAYRIELEDLVAQSKASDGPSWPSDAALRNLDRAEEALRSYDTDLAWRCFTAANRLALYGHHALAGQSAVNDRARAILQEAQQKKLSGWRKSTIVDLLDGDADVSPDKVVFAWQILDEHHANVYHKLRVVERQLGLLAIAALVAVIVWIAAAPSLAVSLANSGPAGSANLALDSRGFAAAIVLFGVMGAIVSGILSMARGPEGRAIPALLLDSMVTLARLALGAVAALAAATFLASGIIAGLEPGPELVLAVAFAAGFSERLVVRAVESVPTA